MSIAEAQRVTPDDLLAMPDSELLELVNGELVEKNVSVLSTRVEAIVLAKLSGFADQNNLGEVWPGTQGIRGFPDDPDKIRKADVFFVRRERFSPEFFPEGFLSIAPDLAVEVLSPGDLAYEIDRKVAGVQLVWVVNPETRTVMIHRHDGSTAKRLDHDELAGDDVLPGFRCRVSDFFPATN